jgi:AraC-like DNA-binding protein
LTFDISSILPLERMKWLSHIVRYCFIFLFVLFKTNSGAQTSLNRQYLSDDIENLLYSNPDQALKIAQYVLSKTNISGKQKARVNYLISKAYTVKGDYSSAMNFLIEEQNYEEYLTETDRVNIQIDKIALLRELALDKQAKIILESLEKTLVHTKDETTRMYLKISLAIEKAKFLLKEGKPSEGVALLKSQLFSVNKLTGKTTAFQLNYTITLGQLFLEQKKYAEAKHHFESAINLVNKENENDVFLKIDALDGLSRVYYFQQEYDKALLFNQEALAYAKRLDNPFLQLRMTQQQKLMYFTTNDLVNYKLTSKRFFQLSDSVADLEQDAINTAYNLISQKYANDYDRDKSKYSRMIYVVSGLFLIAIIISIFFWQKAVERKKGLKVIINYIEVTKSNLLGSFAVSDKKQEPRKNFILKETEEQILIKLKKFESSKRFLHKDISLAMLAGQLDSNTKYLSEIINTHYNVNFNTYINKLRVNYIILKLKTDPNFINYKISYLAENCGFASHSTFATVFKSITGISPVKFIELLNQEKEENALVES